MIVSPRWLLNDVLVCRVVALGIRGLGHAYCDMRCVVILWIVNLRLLSEIEMWPKALVSVCGIFVQVG